jgi:hypothetical protein
MDVPSRRREEEAHIPVEVLAQYVGSYGSSAVPDLAVVSLEGNRLMFSLAGAGKIPLIAGGRPLRHAKK